MPQNIRFGFALFAFQSVRVWPDAGKSTNDLFAVKKTLPSRFAKVQIVFLAVHKKTMRYTKNFDRQRI